ncbi:hypothetical protein [Azospirillum sp. ST 5-10]|uniref:hypothetical protein n=1 Tax=unclassified Azospirillum TaxID=2630922 RepID=UPI003F4A061A
MASIIVALFDCPDEANRVADGLAGAGVPRDDLYFAGGEPAPSPSELDELADTLAKLGVAEADARNYRDGVAGGGALLLVRADEAAAPRIRMLIDRTAHGGTAPPPGAAPADAPECDSIHMGQAAGGYGTRGAATAFGGIERVQPRTRVPAAAKR